jgi:hypothetical protein
MKALFLILTTFILCVSGLALMANGKELAGQGCLLVALFILFIVTFCSKNE